MSSTTISWLTWVLAGMAGIGTALLVSVWVKAGRYPEHRLVPYLGNRKAVWARKSKRQTAIEKTQKVLIKALGMLGSTNKSVQQKLILADRSEGLAAVRFWQIIFAAGGGILTVIITGSLAIFGNLGVAQAVFITVCGLLAGGMIPDYLLAVEAKKRQLALAEQAPDAIELLALAVGSGENILSAINRVAQLCCDPIGGELKKIGNDCAAGIPLLSALEDFSKRLQVVSLTRLTQAIITGVTHGTPLAQILRGQAADSRAQQRTDLLERGGRQEIRMMIPVVFLILPVCVLFALYPGIAILKF